MHAGKPWRPRCCPGSPGKRAHIHSDAGARLCLREAAGLFGTLWDLVMQSRASLWPGEALSRATVLEALMQCSEEGRKCLLSHCLKSSPAGPGRTPLLRLLPLLIDMPPAAWLYAWLGIELINLTPSLLRN